MQTVLIIVSTALLSSFFTSLVMIWLWREIWRQQLEQRLRQLQDDMSRTVETRVRRVVTESLAEIKPSDMLRETTWKAAKSGSDLLTDGFSSFLSKWRKTDHIEH
ncbi:MAG: hypothetical protein KBF23_08045 [Agitococcus sp.]|nr:hypothetical protein [Moraxellaceae bacterium]MBP9217104.1 hypothetical protein [Agitococcus sp.]MBK7299539.1 hypothetical protein [Moraxellaceae bacterium]MBK8327266.1 hypothetical protein [Moraxellaceae bacterium]MBK9185256.1 hypothetical protein [Moraxellaceae bacterium]